MAATINLIWQSNRGQTTFFLCFGNLLILFSLLGWEEISGRKGIMVVCPLIAPDSWVVLETYFSNEQLVLDVKGFGKYQINSVNKGPLSYAVVSAGKGKKVDNAKLKEIWEQYAKVQNG